MGKEIDIKQDIDASLAAVQRLRDRRDALLDEIQEIDTSLEGIQRQIADILGKGAMPAPFPVSPGKFFEKKTARKDAEMTVNAAVLHVIRDAHREISKSEIRIGAMRLADAFSESALNAALTHWVDHREIKNTSRGFYTAL